MNDRKITRLQMKKKDSEASAMSSDMIEQTVRLQEKTLNGKSKTVVAEKSPKKSKDQESLHDATIALTHMSNRVSVKGKTTVTVSSKSTDKKNDGKKTSSNNTYRTMNQRGKYYQKKKMTERGLCTSDDGPTTSGSSDVMQNKNDTNSRVGDTNAVTEMGSDNLHVAQEKWETRRKRVSPKSEDKAMTDDKSRVSKEQKMEESSSDIPKTPSKQNSALLLRKSDDKAMIEDKSHVAKEQKMEESRSDIPEVLRKQNSALLLRKSDDKAMIEDKSHVAKKQMDESSNDVPERLRKQNSTLLLRKLDDKTMIADKSYVAKKQMDESSNDIPEVLRKQNSALLLRKSDDTTMIEDKSHVSKKQKMEESRSDIPEVISKQNSALLLRKSHDEAMIEDKSHVEKKQKMDQSSSDVPEVISKQNSALLLDGTRRKIHQGDTDSDSWSETEGYVYESDGETDVRVTRSGVTGKGAPRGDISDIVPKDKPTKEIPVGAVVWAKYDGTWWPAMVVSEDVMSSCDVRYVRVYWFDDNSVSLVPRSNVMLFVPNYVEVYEEVPHKGWKWKRGVLAAIKVCESRMGIKLFIQRSDTELMEWARTDFCGYSLSISHPNTGLNSLAVP